jgi:hypothetical protein
LQHKSLTRAQIIPGRSASKRKMPYFQPKNDLHKKTGHLVNEKPNGFTYAIT